MKNYHIQTQNISNSLVFYRALFDRMPDELGASNMKYSMPDFNLEIVESSHPQIHPNAHMLEVSNRRELEMINDKMGKFKALAKLREDCHSLRDAFGLLDPDGNKWIIGNPQTKVHFEKCYIK